jgi:GTP pyrophosphokinase
MSFIKEEKQYDKAVIFLSEAVSRAPELPVATIMHSVRVGLYLQRRGCSKEVVLAGLLHDVVEDTHVTVGQIEKSFGREVAALVEAMTFDEDIPSDKRSRDSIDRCNLLGRDALLIKAADLVDNLRFYLPYANPNKLGQLSESLRYFLDASVDELGQEDPWHQLERQRSIVLAMIPRGNEDR